MQIHKQCSLTIPMTEVLDLLRNAGWPIPPPSNSNVVRTQVNPDIRYETPVNEYAKYDGGRLLLTWNETETRVAEKVANPPQLVVTSKKDI